MGSRGRSIRLRIYFLVAIPLVTILALFGYVTYTSVTSWLNLDRAPSLIKATSIPITTFVNILQAERRAAVVYLSQPSAANLNAYQHAIMASKNGELPFQAAVTSPETRSNATADETAAIGTMLSDLAGIDKVRAAVTAKMLPPLDAFGAYTKVIIEQDTVFQAEAASITDATAATQGLGLIASVNAREDMFEQDVVLAGALASGSISPQDRVVFSLAAGRQQDDTALYTAMFTPAERAVFNAPLSTPQMKTLLANLTQVQQGVAGGATLAQMEQQGLTPAAWQELTTAIGNANYQGGLNAATVD